MTFQTNTQSCYIYMRKAQLFIVLSPYLISFGKWKPQIFDTSNPYFSAMHIPEQLLNLSCPTPIMMNMQIFLRFVFSTQNISMWQGQEWEMLLITGTGFAMRDLVWEGFSSASHPMLPREDDMNWVPSVHTLLSSHSSSEDLPGKLKGILLLPKEPGAKGIAQRQATPDRIQAGPG